MKFSDPRAFVNQFVVGLLVTIGFGGTVGLGTVWMRHQVSVVAEQNSDLETQIKDVERRIASTSALVEAARSQDVLVGKNEAMHLGLEEMTQSQVFAVRDDPMQLLVARANRRVFETDRVGAKAPRIQLNLDQAGTTNVAASAPRNAPVGQTSPARTAPSADPRQPIQFAFTE